MARLTAARRHALPAREFAIPEHEAYPIDTAGRAKSALGYVKKNGNGIERKRVKRAVERKYPNMQVR